MKLFVGNLRFEIGERELRDLFSVYDADVAIELIYDPHTRVSRGFAYITIASEAEAARAISDLDGQDFRGRKLHLDAARPRRPAAEIQRERFERRYVAKES